MLRLVYTIVFQILVCEPKDRGTGNCYLYVQTIEEQETVTYVFKVIVTYV